MIYTLKGNLRSTLGLGLAKPEVFEATFEHLTRTSSPSSSAMRARIVRAATVAPRSGRCQVTGRRAFTQCARLREAPPQTPRYEPPTPQKDSKGNDPRLSRFAKIFGVGIGILVAFGYRAVKGPKDGGSSNKSADGFLKYRLTGREDVSSTTAIFTLKPITAGINLKGEDLRRAITSVQFKQPQLQIARSYTLLPTEPGQDPSELRFLIKKEQNGEVSGYLHRLAMGAEVEVRGPSAEYVLPEKVSKVVFLAGGTGIAPALQAARAVAGEADVHILWANRKREECEGGKSDIVKASSSWSETFAGWFSPFGTPLKQESQQSTAVAKKGKIVAQLEDLKRNGGGRMAIDYFVDEEGKLIQPTDAMILARSSFSTGAADTGRKVMFVSGPEGFVKHWAGPKEWANGREVQGPLGGVLSTLDLKNWEIVKL